MSGFKLVWRGRVAKVPACLQMVLSGDGSHCSVPVVRRPRSGRKEMGSPKLIAAARRIP